MQHIHNCIQLKECSNNWQGPSVRNKASPSDNDWPKLFRTDWFENQSDRFPFKQIVKTTVQSENHGSVWLVSKLISNTEEVLSTNSIQYHLQIFNYFLLRLIDTINRIKTGPKHPSLTNMNQYQLVPWWNREKLSLDGSFSRKNIWPPYTPGPVWCLELTRQCHGFILWFHLM